MYMEMRREDVTLASLQQSGDALRQETYRRVMTRIGSDLDEAAQERPLRQLPDGVQSTVEEVVTDVNRLIRDRQVMLRAVDSLWVRHLTNLDALREGIGLRAYGQQNPLVAYRKEAHEMYEALLGDIQRRVARSIFRAPQLLVVRSPKRKLRTVRPGVSQGRAPKPPGPSEPHKDLGRNDPCWCGSGKKYKHCHLRQDQKARRG
jgi:preprotein translocase subunit SecA